MTTIKIYGLTEDELGRLRRSRLMRVGVSYNETELSFTTPETADLPTIINMLDWHGARIESIAGTLEIHSPREDQSNTNTNEDDDCLSVAHDLSQRMRHLSVSQALAVVDILRMALTARLNAAVKPEGNR